MPIHLPLLIALLLLPEPAVAHGLTVIPPEGIWYAWSIDPLVLVPLALTHWLYGRGVTRMWTRAGAGRGVARWRAACFLAGEVTLVLALVWPFDAVGGTLFSAHMVQHMLLMVVAAPLLVLGAPLAPMMRALPERWRPGAAAAVRRLRPGRFLTRPSVAAVIQGVALWAWHAPAPFQAALLDDAVHTAEHVTFMASAVLFWWSVLHAGRDGPNGYGAAAAWTLVTVLHGGMLGALLTFARVPLYPAYGDSASLWGLTALEDQQLAGLIMWVPTGIIHLGAGLWLIGAWLSAVSRRNANVTEPT
ncbi:cytochrome c oxidase assembly protein [Skermanella mucosa]|uniref:cytochrome c oxidase assembly protein n=1 Tax=Skermanella mucosa TaxID=1789672 RepID=UPI00192A89A1|nr:cytochrome c oxidase assembly protein [Skermanella mucosa]UEM19337.1 cytochrome c oxidase assembly protein [Skermanella mucosa]